MLHDVEAVVLVGGKGTRLRPLTLSAPKPMLPTAGVPFLAHLLSRIPYKKLPKEKVKLPGRSTKGAYDDDKAIARRRFVKQRY